MSSRSMKDHLQDILDAIYWIEHFTSGLTLQDYVATEIVKSAVERKFSILSEATYRMGEEAAAVSALHDWEGLRGMGNVIRHAYHRIKDEELWDAIGNDLPELKRSAQAALNRIHS